MEELRDNTFILEIVRVAGFEPAWLGDSAPSPPRCELGAPTNYAKLGSSKEDFSFGAAEVAPILLLNYSSSFP